jgi:uncharacterized protein (DUF58 family)
VVHLPPLELPKGAAEGQAQARFRARQWTANAAGVRDYQPGDPLRRIHWPSTARRERLLVKQFDLEVSGDLCGCCLTWEHWPDAWRSTEDQCRGAA